MKKTLLIIGIAVIALGACKKKGCTDSDAVNYDSGAGKDDQSCTYSADVVLYYSQDTYLNYMLSNSYNTDLEYYVDGNYMGTNAADNSWSGSSAPPCGESGQMTITLDMAGQKSRLYNFKVTDPDEGDAVVFTASQVISANTCNSVLLQE